MRLDKNTKPYRAVVMGVGNILWADEGFGCRAAEAFHEVWETPETVPVIDGGTLGGMLSAYVEATDLLVVFDCCDFKAAPGTFGVLAGDAIQPWLASKFSAHQEGLNELFATAKLLGRYPEEVFVLGCQPETLEDYGGSLTPKISAAVPAAVAKAAEILASRGIALSPRTEGEKPEPLGDAALSRAAYEAGRPTEAEACRYGDPRFMPGAFAAPEEK